MLPSRCSWVVVVFALVVTSACDGRPPLRLHVSVRTVLIDVQTLGEYPTSVARLRLLDDQNNTVVWEIASNGSAPQLARFSLGIGDNPVQLPDVCSGTYRVVAPDAPTFVLQAGRTYRIDVWGTGTLLSRRTATFVLGQTGGR